MPRNRPGSQDDSHPGTLRYVWISGSFPGLGGRGFSGKLVGVPGNGPGSQDDSHPGFRNTQLCPEIRIFSGIRGAGYSSVAHMLLCLETDSVVKMIEICVTWSVLDLK